MNTFNRFNRKLLDFTNTIEENWVLEPQIKPEGIVLKVAATTNWLLCTWTPTKKKDTQIDINT